MKYKFVIFDFDGTLADTFSWFVKMINSLADQYNFKKVKEEEIETVRGYDLMKVIKHLAVPLWRIPQIAARMRKLMTEDIHNISLFEGVSKLLKKLHDNGHVLAIVSSNSYTNIQHVLGYENMALIEYFECGASMFNKPDKLRKILKISGFKPDESIYIGDELRDIEAAHKAKVASGSVTWGFYRKGPLKAKSPNELFERVEEIAEKMV